jgi:hypothetical protein
VSGVGDLVAFINARLDELELAARAAQLTWTSDEEDDGRVVSMAGVYAYENGYEEPACELAHIALHDPAAVLADVESKRQIVAECHRELTRTQWNDIPDGTLIAELVLQMLALPFASHPDYDEKWAEEP